MTTETTPAAPTTEAVPAPKAPRKAKPSAGKAPAKAAPAKKAASATDRSMADIPAPERKKKLVQLMRKMGATSSGSARSVTELAEKIGYTKFDVYGLLSGTSGKAGSAPACLLATGHVKSVDREDGLGFHLTAKGAKTDFTDRPFARPAAK